ncbi:MAG: hypothetical protein LBO72_07340 [Helicobacteraceae bacterium]|jgi:hypothetical protein|nr:hypothetical protein [Helicobacteraceae bacterium]
MRLNYAKIAPKTAQTTAIMIGQSAYVDLRKTAKIDAQKRQDVFATLRDYQLANYGSAFMPKRAIK